MGAFDDGVLGPGDDLGGGVKTGVGHLIQHGVVPFMADASEHGIAQFEDTAHRSVVVESGQVVDRSTTASEVSGMSGVIQLNLSQGGVQRLADAAAAPSPWKRLWA